MTARAAPRVTWTLVVVGAAIVLSACIRVNLITGQWLLAFRVVDLLPALELAAEGFVNEFLVALPRRSRRVSVDPRGLKGRVVLGRAER